MFCLLRTDAIDNNLVPIKVSNYPYPNFIFFFIMLFFLFLRSMIWFLRTNLFTYLYLIVTDLPITDPSKRNTSKFITVFTQITSFGDGWT